MGFNCVYVLHHSQSMQNAKTNLGKCPLRRWCASITQVCCKCLMLVEGGIVRGVRCNHREGELAGNGGTAATLHQNCYKRIGICYACLAWVRKTSKASCRFVRLCEGKILAWSNKLSCICCSVPAL